MSKALGMIDDSVGQPSERQFDYKGRVVLKHPLGDCRQVLQTEHSITKMFWEDTGSDTLIAIAKDYGRRKPCDQCGVADWEPVRWAVTQKDSLDYMSTIIEGWCDNAEPTA